MKRGLLALIDRGGGSMGSLALISLVASHGSAESFGRFAFMMALAIAAQAAYRAVPGSWLLVTDRPVGLPLAMPAFTLAVYCAAAATATLLFVGYVSGQSLDLVLAVAALCSANVLVDTPRLAAYGAGNARTPALLTTATLALFALALLAVRLSGWPVSSSETVAVYACAVAAPGAALLLSRPPCRSHGVRQYLGSHRQDLGGQVTSAASTAAAQALVPVLLQVVAGPTLVGAVRGAQSLAGVPSQLPTALQPVLLSDTARKFRRGSSPIRAFPLWAGGVSLLYGVFGLAGAFLPDEVGAKFFGVSWNGISQALLPILVSAWATSCLIAVETAFRVQHAMRRFAAIKTLGLALLCSGALIGAGLYSIEGAAWGLAVANITVLLLALASLPTANPKKRASDAAT